MVHLLPDRTAWMRPKVNPHSTTGWGRSDLHQQPHYTSNAR